jgi:hypothetical protein
MGGILGNEAWRRSNGGLWLPRVFGMPETVYGWCRCGETVCECACENCAAVNGEHINNAPCCWKVVISGITDNNTGDSCNCAGLNTTFYLNQDNGPDSNPCLWNCRYTNAHATCGASEITLEITESEGTYYITVTMGSHTWQYSSENEIDCRTVTNLDVPVTGTGDAACDSSEATCTISAVPKGQACPCGPTLSCCTGSLPDRFAVDLTNLAWTDETGGCDQCNEIAATYILNYDRFQLGDYYYVYKQTNLCKGQSRGTFPPYSWATYDASLYISLALRCQTSQSCEGTSHNILRATLQVSLTYRPPYDESGKALEAFYGYAITDGPIDCLDAITSASNEDGKWELSCINDCGVTCNKPGESLQKSPDSINCNLFDSGTVEVWPI